MMEREELVRFGVEIHHSVFRIASSNFPPLSPPPRALQGRNRFDDPLIGVEDDPGGFSILYVASEAKAAFLEVLYQFRPRIQDARTLASEMVLDVPERDDFLDVRGLIPSDWLDNRQLVEARAITFSPVFDLTNPSAIQSLRSHLAPSLIALGIDDLDFSHVLSDNRNLTRAISRWLWTMTNDSGDPLFSGIRYLSRFDPESICLALYQDRYTIDGDIDIQPITADTPGFAEAASTLRLQIA